MRKSSTARVLSTAKKMTDSVSTWWSRDYGSRASDTWMTGLFKRRVSAFDEDNNLDPKNDVFALAQYRTAIANFVHIMTGDSKIPVEFNTSGVNCTDGKKIYISASMKEKDFDTNVGLALHESSHILYTDVDYVHQNLHYVVFSVLDTLKRTNGERLFTPEDIQRRCAFERYGLEHKYLHTLLNVIEDFYIDAMTYASAPGYREYYRALYIKYFDDVKIVKGLHDSQFMTVNGENYICHLINIRNPKRNLNALPSLSEIWEVLDLENIRRLETQQDRIDLALKVFTMIVENLPEQELWYDNNSDTNQEQGASDNANEEEGEEESGEGASANTGEEEGEGASDNANEEQGEEESGEGASAVSSDTEKGMAQNQIKALTKLFETQKKLINGEIKKTTLRESVAKQVNVATQIDLKERVVLKNNPDFYLPQGIKTIVIRKVTEDFFNSNISNGFGLRHINQSVAKNIDTYISLGKLFAKRLQVRNEVRTQTSNRLKSGKIDRRILHEVGFDNYDIFKKININVYKDSYVHISIDQSGSMGGDKINEAVRFAVIFATASKIIKNLHVVVSVRSIYSRGESRSMMHKPYIVNVFDSKIHGLSYIRMVFPHIRSHDCTPEGMTFEAIQEDIKKEAIGKDAFFINLCDGQPCADNYSGEKAKLHSRRQLERMEKFGISTSVYFIGSEYEYRNTLKTYPKNCHHLANASEINKIVTHMNKALLRASAMS